MVLPHAPERGPRDPERFNTCLHGRVLARGRSFPVNVTELSQDGLVAEGSDLAHVLGPFALEIAIESSGGPAWNPKSAGPQFLHLFSASAERVGDSLSEGRINARFTEMSEPARRLLLGYLRQIAADRMGRSAGGAVARPPERLTERG